MKRNEKCFCYFANYRKNFSKWNCAQRKLVSYTPLQNAIGWKLFSIKSSFWSLLTYNSEPSLLSRISLTKWRCNWQWNDNISKISREFVCFPDSFEWSIRIKSKCSGSWRPSQSRYQNLISLRFLGVVK